MSGSTLIHGPQGIQPETVIAQCFADSAIGIYDVCMLDLANVETGLEIRPGIPSIFGHVRDPVAADVDTNSIVVGVFGIAQEAAADGDLINVMFKGITLCNVEAATTAGQLMKAATDGRLDVAVVQAAATSKKIIAIALEADSAQGGIAQASLCWFNGIEGFGMEGG